MVNNLEGLKEYFKYLQNVGYVNIQSAYQLIVFNYLQDLYSEYTKGNITLDTDDKLTIQSYLDCLKHSNCFIRVKNLYDLCCK